MSIVDQLGSQPATWSLINIDFDLCPKVGQFIEGRTGRDREGENWQFKLPASTYRSANARSSLGGGEEEVGV